MDICVFDKFPTDTPQTSLFQQLVSCNAKGSCPQATEGRFYPAGTVRDSNRAVLDSMDKYYGDSGIDY